MIESFPVIYKKRQKVAAAFATIAVSLSAVSCSASPEQPVPTQTIAPSECAPTPSPIPTNIETVTISKTDILCRLGSLAIKGRAPMTGYDRDKSFGGWKTVHKCDTRERILKRDLTNVTVDAKCEVLSGLLDDPYSGQQDIPFVRGQGSSSKVQIDHVVALGNAWQTGAQQMDTTKRRALANDGLNLLAVSGTQNDIKKDGNAATWLPPANDCDYVARQTLVKGRYGLWVTQAEHNTIQRVLTGCTEQEFSFAQ